MTKRPGLHAVVMAGGSGTRFWPLSRRRRPKQFLPIVSDRTMLEETFLRVRALVPARNVFTIANAAQTRTIRRLLPELPAGNALVEPLSRNTAPSILLATAIVFRRNPEAVVAVLPSDHRIEDGPLFLRKLEAAAEAAARTESLVTFGVTPEFPSTGYGYIRYDTSRVRRYGGESFHPVLGFHEKPSRETAERFLESGGYAWNSGMFVWRASVFARTLSRFAPGLRTFWDRILGALEEKSALRMKRIFADIPAVSIDYALMEKAEKTIVVSGDFGWSDVGSWSALGGIWKRDGRGNAAQGETEAIDASGNVVFNPGRLTALIGVDDLVIVSAGDALLVCRKDRDQDVRRILDRLKKEGKNRRL